jgi:ribonucleoside-diphosphate reductase alpha chain
MNKECKMNKQKAVQKKASGSSALPVKTNEADSYISFDRYFTRNLSDGQTPYDAAQWVVGDTKIEERDLATGETTVRFEQKGVEFPARFSELAKRVVASKYFYGEQGTDQREFSFRQLVSRVADTMAQWGLRQGYFKTEEEAQAFCDENAAITLGQRAAYNSPTWFNVGIDKSGSHNRSYIIDAKTGKVLKRGNGNSPQTSACFIQHVDDDINDLNQLASNEVLLFKNGSGTGTNFSTLRSSREKLSGGGTPSGPVSYMVPLDKSAGVIKSGGKTRRAAKMAILDTDHPDIMEFVQVKTNERRKMQALLDAGFLYDDAAATVDHQNTNLSVRSSDAFMQAVENDDLWQTVPVNNPELAENMPRYRARSELLRAIAEGTYVCGDPGMQFDDTINAWHTCADTTRISSSNPCSEYMFVDDSACNLASQNLVAFLDEKGRFRHEDYSQSVRTVAIAQDLEIDASGYPTREIAQNAHDYRPLGQGNTNLGSLLMRFGLSYDSDEARTVAATIQALQTAKVYQASVEMAERVGPFKRFEENKGSFLRVLNMHREALREVDREKLPEDSGLKEAYDEAGRSLDDVIDRAGKTGIRNSQATVYAPTGTISFMMDCDTTGIEPDLALRKSKALAGGGTLEIVNTAVAPALRKLGYEDDEIRRITDYVDQHGTVEGSELREEHLPVFDCALKPREGTRVLNHEAHLKMMAAVQPFLSGAISKTVNIPEDTSVEEIMEIYVSAWKMGLKSVAIYRDGSHPHQPLQESGSGGLETKAEESERELKWGERKKLPEVHDSKIVKFNLGGEDNEEGYYHLGFYPDGSPGEVWIDLNKQGSTTGGTTRALAVAWSLLLQYGMPPEKLVKTFKGMRFEPSGFACVGGDNRFLAHSLVDLIARDVEQRFLLPESQDAKKIIEVESEVVEEGDVESQKQKEIEEAYRAFVKGKELGGSCDVCSRTMIKKGHCVEECFCGHMNKKGCGE